MEDAVRSPSEKCASSPNPRDHAILETCVLKRNEWPEYSKNALQRRHSIIRIAMDSQRACPAISLIAGLYTPRNTFRDHMALCIEGYLISVNRFYRRWKYRKHFRLLRDLGRVAFQVDIKLQRSGVIFQYAPILADTRTRTRSRASVPPLPPSPCFSISRKLIHQLS